MDKPNMEPTHKLTQVIERDSDEKFYKNYQNQITENHRGNLRFYPEAMKCGKCKQKVAINKDVFIPPCCGDVLTCYDCYGTLGEEVRCISCGRRTLYARIKADIFLSIEKTAMENMGIEANLPEKMEEPLYDVREVCVYRMIKGTELSQAIIPVGNITKRKYDQEAVACMVMAGSRKINYGELHREEKEKRLNRDIYDGIREKSFPSKEHIIFMYEEPMMTNRVVQEMVREIKTFDQEYDHDYTCFRYHNIEYLCDSVNKMRKRRVIDGNEARITIHDVLTFTCFYCGHDEKNRLLGTDGRILQITKHSLFNCHIRCCGTFLDKRKLQYLDGKCKCGEEIMEKLGIIPASEEEHLWRQKLYHERRNVQLGKSLKMYLRPIFNRMQIETPAMITWYLVAQGELFFRQMREKTADEIEEILGRIMTQLNGEFTFHKPIKGKHTNRMKGYYLLVIKEGDIIDMDLVSEVTIWWVIKVRVR